MDQNNLNQPGPAPQPNEPVPPMPEAPQQPQAPEQPGASSIPQDVPAVEQPPAPEAPTPDPAQAQQYYQEPTQVPNVGSEYQPSSGGGWLGTVFELFRSPMSFIENPPSNIVGSLIFVGINLAIMIGSLFVLSFLTMLKMEVELSGEIWGELFKTILFYALYPAIFLFIIAGVIFVIAAMGKKQTDFGQSFAVSSVLSLNFLAIGASTVLSLIALYLTDIIKFTNLLSDAVIGTVFVFTSVLLVQSIAKNVDLSYFLSTALYVVSVVLSVFLMGQMIDKFSSYFTVNFGNFGRNDASTLSNAYSSFDDYLDDFDFSDWDF